MSFDFKSAQKEAATIIKYFGTTCKVTSISGKTYSAVVAFLPTTKTDGESTATSTGSYAMDLTKTALMVGSVAQPLPGDQVTIGTEVTTVTSSEGFSPSGSTNLFWKLQLGN